MFVRLLVYCLSWVFPQSIPCFNFDFKKVRVVLRCCEICSNEKFWRYLKTYTIDWMVIWAIGCCWMYDVWTRSNRTDFFIIYISAWFIIVKTVQFGSVFVGYFYFESSIGIWLVRRRKLGRRIYLKWIFSEKKILHKFPIKSIFSSRSFVRLLYFAFIMLQSS